MKRRQYRIGSVVLPAMVLLAGVGLESAALAERLATSTRVETGPIPMAAEIPPLNLAEPGEGAHRVEAQRLPDVEGRARPGRDPELDTVHDRLHHGDADGAAGAVLGFSTAGVAAGSPAPARATLMSHCCSSALIRTSYSSSWDCSTMIVQASLMASRMSSMHPEVTPRELRPLPISLRARPIDSEVLGKHTASSRFTMPPSCSRRWRGSSRPMIQTNRVPWNLLGVETP